MNFNFSKFKTISSFFTSSATKQQKIDEVTNPAPTPTATKNLVSETSNLFCTAVSSGTVNIHSSASELSSSQVSSLWVSSTLLTSALAASSLFGNISRSLSDPSSQLVSSSLSSSPLHIDSDYSIIDVCHNLFFHLYL